MIKKYVAMGLGALIAVAPVAAMATTSTSKTHTASHKSHMASRATYGLEEQAHGQEATAPEAPKS